MAGYLIINGARLFFTGGPRVRNYLDHPELKLEVGKGGDGVDLGINRGDHADVTKIIFHTTKGKVATLKPGLGAGVDDGLRCARFWSGSERQSGAHLVVDRDGDIAQLADVGRVCAYHCGDSVVNQNSIGIELYEELVDGVYALYEGQLQSAVWLTDVLTFHFGIQRQFHGFYRGRPVQRLDRGGRDCVGVFGHREVSDRRGAGDPGEQIFDALVDAGYEPLDFDYGQDLVVWGERQRSLGVPVTGVPDVATVRALRLGGRPGGQWVRRPTDPDGNLVAP